MKKLFLIVTLLFWCGTLSAQQQTLLQAAQAEINRLNIVLEDVKVDRDNLTLAIVELKKAVLARSAGLEKTRLLLQDAINNGGKVDWKTLINDVKWNLVLPDSTAKRPNNKTKDKK